MPIKVLLTAGLAALLAYTLIQRVAPRLVKGAILLGVVAGGYFVWVPSHATVVANWLGVGRGADLLFYLWILLSIAVGLNLNFKVRAARREITQLTREIALATPREPRDPGGTSRTPTTDSGTGPASGDPS